VKTDRFFSAAILAAAVLLAGLLAVAQPGVVLAAAPPRPEETPRDETPQPPKPAVVQRSRSTLGLSFQITIGRRSSALAERLTTEIALVQKRFDRNRRELPVIRTPGGGRAYLHQEVAGLIDLTGKDLDQAIERVGEPGLEALRAWSAEEFRRIQQELAPPDHTAALPFGLSTPHAVAVVASLEVLPLPRLASVNAAAPQQGTITAEKSNGLLDQVGEVVGRIFSLAKKDDLEVDLWVGSTPTQATFRFWSQGKLKGATPAPTILQTNGKRKRVLRGLYTYKAALAKGAVTELIEYPSSAGAPQESEQLDLVNGSGFFCCEFNRQYCHDVDNEKECR
jgi:hypothetical protein